MLENCLNELMVAVPVIPERLGDPPEKNFFLVQESDFRMNLHFQAAVEGE